MSEITLQIDGRKVEAKEGMTILEAAQSVGISIPTLCAASKMVIPSLDSTSLPSICKVISLIFFTLSG